MKPIGQLPAHKELPDWKLPQDMNLKKWLLSIEERIPQDAGRYHRSSIGLGF